MVHWKSDLLFTLTSLLLYIIKHSSNAGLIRDRLRNPVAFQTRFFATKEIVFHQLRVAWKRSILDLVGFLYEVQRYSSPLYISNVFAFEQTKNFSLVFNSYVEEDLNLKVSFFWKENISWHQLKIMAIVKDQIMAIVIVKWQWQL